MTHALIDHTTDRDIETLIELLASNNPAERERSRNVLVSRGRAAVIPLIEQMRSPFSQVCWEAAKALGSIKDPAAATALAQTLSHEDGDVRWAAAHALIGLGLEGLKQTLVELLTKAHSAQTLQAARHVVSHFAHRYRGEPLKPLLEKFRAFEPGVAVPPAALHVLHEIERGNLQL